jgi:hypothetical protein
MMSHKAWRGRTSVQHKPRVGTNADGNKAYKLLQYSQCQMRHATFPMKLKCWLGFALWSRQRARFEAGG